MHYLYNYRVQKNNVIFKSNIQRLKEVCDIVNS